MDQELNLKFPNYSPFIEKLSQEKAEQFRNLKRLINSQSEENFKIAWQVFQSFKEWEKGEKITAFKALFKHIKRGRIFYLILYLETPIYIKIFDYTYRKNSLFSCETKLFHTVHHKKGLDAKYKHSFIGSKVNRIYHYLETIANR